LYPGVNKRVGLLPARFIKHIGTIHIKV
jgi:hypothetical protein